MKSPDPPARSAPDRFESFDLTIERIGDVYRAEVTRSPVGPRPPIPVDLSYLEPDEPRPARESKLTRDVWRQPVGRKDLRRAGERLFRAVFVGKVAEAFRASIERVRSHGHGLRIRLRLDRAAELATLPWEALWDPDARAFLADQPDLPIVRDLSVTGATPAPASAAKPFRLLALFPEPPGLGKLGGGAEWQRIREHLAPLIAQGVVVADPLEPPTLEELGNRIERAHYHVLHVVAHGEPGDRGTGGVLKLEDGTGGPDDVTGIELTRALERRTPPRLVVLNTCHGARSAVDDAFDGMAQHLLSRGVPAVVAMRTSISDKAAVKFAAALYQELAKGRTVETAMVEARRALSLGEHRAEWATPVLYLRGEDVRILEGGSEAGPRFSSAVTGRRSRIMAAALAAVVLGWLVVLGIRMLPGTMLETCPSPPGLQDLEFVKIKPGVLVLGDRTLTIEKELCIATKEVTRRDWREVMGALRRRLDWPPDRPMTDVTPDEVNGFLERLQVRDVGAVYRLPTAEEWEYAARARRKTDYFFGDDPTKLHRYGNCNNRLRDDDHDEVAPVGFYKPNPWGLYDVHGNVAEWVQWPEDAGPRNVHGYDLAMRLGGSFENTPGNCTFSRSRSTVRADRDDRPDTGFRVVRELSRPQVSE